MNSALSDLHVFVLTCDAGRLYQGANERTKGSYYEDARKKDPPI